MLRPLWAALNPGVSAGPLLVPHQLHFSREAGSFFDPMRICTSGPPKSGFGERAAICPGIGGSAASRHLGHLRALIITPKADVARAPPPTGISGIPPSRPDVPTAE